MDQHDEAEPMAALDERPGQPIASLHARQLLVSSSDDAGVRVIALGGELDLASAPRLERALDDAIAEAQAGVVIDLCELQFMDSTGLRTLIVGQRRAAELQCPYVIARRPGEFVGRVFELAGADRAFELYATRDEAINAARSSAGQSSS